VEDAQKQNETPEMNNGDRLLSDPHNQMGGVIQPVNPHFCGNDVIVDIGEEDPDVQWLPNPLFEGVVIAGEEAIRLSQDEIAAIHVEPERTNSTDDERPASSYPLLDRRRYREESIVALG
jgi:hypothetical protein